MKEELGEVEHIGVGMGGLGGYSPPIILSQQLVNARQEESMAHDLPKGEVQIMSHVSGH
jgi:hypothetical protein